MQPFKLTEAIITQPVVTENEKESHNTTVNNSGDSWLDFFFIDCSLPFSFPFFEGGWRNYKTFVPSVFTFFICTCPEIAECISAIQKYSYKPLQERSEPISCCIKFILTFHHIHQNQWCDSLLCDHNTNTQYLRHPVFILYLFSLKITIQKAVACQKKYHHLCLSALSSIEPID